MALNKKTDRQFREEMAQCNQSIELLESYINSTTKILVQCCVCGHQWKARPDHLLEGHGCIKCAHKKAGQSSIQHALEKGNSLSLYPHLVTEWDYKTNHPVIPRDVPAGSNKEYWWQCKEGHSFRAKVSNRTYRNDGCPYCSHHKPIIGVTDLKTTHPELCGEWNYEKNGGEKPEFYMAGSGKKVYWMCLFGHEWKASISSRTKGNGCPKCSRRFRTSFPEQAVYYYLKKVFPDAVSGFQDSKNSISELDIYVQSIKIGVEYDGKNWHSSSEAEKREQRKYYACKSQGIRLIRVREDNNGVPSCDDIIFTEYANSKNLDDLNDSIVQLLDLLGINCFDIDVTRDRLKIESSYYAIIREKSIAHRFPTIAKEWDYKRNEFITPYMVNPGSSNKYWWKCSKCGESYEMSPALRARGCSCQKCGNRRKAMSHHNNWINSHSGIDITHPHLLEEWDYYKNDGISPSDVTKGNQTKVWWKCKTCGHSWQASIDNRSKGRGCPQCRINLIGKK